MKTAFSGISLFLFAISYNAYLLVEKYYVLPKSQLKIMNYLPILFILIANDIALCRGKLVFLQTQFIVISKIMLYLVIINILLVQFKMVVSDPYTNMIIINSGTALATLMIVTSAWRHGHFKT